MHLLDENKAKDSLVGSPRGNQNRSSLRASKSVGGSRTVSFSFFLWVVFSGCYLLRVFSSG